jgi:hypothetical protein
VRQPGLAFEISNAGAASIKVETASFQFVANAAAATSKSVQLWWNTAPTGKASLPVLPGAWCAPLVYKGRARKDTRVEAPATVCYQHN